MSDLADDAANTANTDSPAIPAPPDTPTSPVVILTDLPNDSASDRQSAALSDPRAFEWLLRLGLWGAIFFAFNRYISQLSGAPASMLNISLFGILSAFILFATVPSVARALKHFAEAQPIIATLLPLILLAPLSRLMQPDNRFELSEILLTAIVLLLPVALAVLNTPAFRWADLTMGWFAVLVPLLLPFTRIAPVDPPQTTARLIVGAFPLVLLLLTTQAQKRRLNYLFICAILSLWATFELSVLPLLASDPGLPLPLKSLLPGGYLQLGLLAVAFYIVLVAGKFSGLGFSFASTNNSAPQDPSTPTDWLKSLIEFMIFASVAVAFMWISRAYRMALPTSLPAQALPNLALFFLLSALPAELLFRGVLLRYLRDGLRLPTIVAIALSTLAFAIAGLPSLSFGGFELPTLSALISPLASPVPITLPISPPPPPSFITRPMVEFALNLLMGVFYARLYLRLRNLPVVAAVHALFMWVYWVFASVI